MTDDECLFCKIASGKMDAYTVYEDAETIAFLDINPVSKGHTLVIPMTHAETLPDLNRDRAEAVFRTVHRVTTQVQEKLDPDGINLLQNNGEAAGQEVGHVHVHVIPRYADGDGFDFSFDQGSLDDEDAEALVDELRDQ